MKTCFAPFVWLNTFFRIQHWKVYSLRNEKTFVANEWLLLCNNLVYPVIHCVVAVDYEGSWMLSKGRERGREWGREKGSRGDDDQKTRQDLSRWRRRRIVYCVKMRSTYFEVNSTPVFLSGLQFLSVGLCIEVLLCASISSPSSSPPSLPHDCCRRHQEVRPVLTIEVNKVV